MADLETASAIIGDIYDAALDPGLWVGVLQKMANFVGGPSSALVSHDTSAAAASFYYSWGDDPHYTKLYFEKYVKLNPTLGAMALMRVGDVISISELVPIDELRRSRLYLEWAKPQGYADATIAVLEQSAMTTVHATVTHHDRDSPVGDDVRRRMTLLMPHVRRAVAIARLVDRHKTDVSILADAVDAIAAGVFLVHTDARLIRVNEAGRRMLDARALVRENHGRLEAASPDARAALADAVAGTDDNNFTVQGQRATIALTAPDESPYVAHVLPLTTGTRRQAGAKYGARAAVFIHPATPNQPTALEAIAQHFQLTPAELRVLVAIVEVGGVPDVAAVLGISETTVKTHLQRLFEKTGTRRQADLVKRVAAYSNPLVK
jgi:DNA-binding CsgD family transcriptional regulator